MKRRFLNIYTILLAMLLVTASCTTDEVIAPVDSEVPEGYVKVSFNTDIPEMQTVQVRAVDPDGLDVQNMTLFCFNTYGLFITTVDATELTTNSGISGTFDAIIPEETKIIHFIANQNSALYSNDDFKNKTEELVLAAMEGASGMLIYWARFEGSQSGEVLKSELAAIPGGIKMIRNQAKISIANWDTPYLRVTGFVSTNIHAFGTVAPHHNDEGFAWPGSEPYVTLPHNTSMMSDISEVDTRKEEYLFEHENRVDNPVSIIIKGFPAGSDVEKYYRVSLVDSEGEQLPIRRNHSYVLNIKGELTYPSDTFEEALNATFTNNVWITIESWVNEIGDDKYKLSVEKTGVVLDSKYAGEDYILKYTVTGVNGTAITAADIADVSWTGDNNVANHNIKGHSFNVVDGVGRGEITISLNPVTQPIQKGKLLVKKGHLQRIIEINVIETMSFVPSWVGTQVYGEDVGEFVTLKFTIPENCPDILYPFPVLVTVNSLDVRAMSGMQLPVIKKGDDGWFGHDYKGHDYKYEYIVNGPGVHRLYFENVLTHPGGYIDSLWIEANHFETLKKNFTYASHQYAITMENMQVYDPYGKGGTIAQDELLLYKLVPRKRNAHVDLDMLIVNNAGAAPEPMNVDAKDEFLLYSKYLDYYEASEPLPAPLVHECNYYAVPDVETSTNGRMMAFKPINADPTTIGKTKGRYSLHLKTTTPVSDDLVRIASNQSTNKSLVNSGVDYDGKTYRSVMFEIATYQPFRFAARVNGLGENATGNAEESVSDVTLTYLPNQKIDIEFDVTSFTAEDGKSVDPFGEEFEIYIDAPMLSIDESRLAECGINSTKLYADATTPGRYIYKVESTRAAESVFGLGNALVADTKAASQTGERKKLPFVTNRVTSQGEITLSSNEEKVVFFKKTFEITNERIVGDIKYVQKGTGNVLNVPKGSFVAFFTSDNGVRIGSIEVTEDGRYSLNLRSEYEFNWMMDNVEFDFKDANGDQYEFKIASLNALYSSKDVTLTLATP